MDARDGGRYALTGLLGRDRELTDLETALDDACQGYGRFYLVSGEPGIGKSSLAAATAELARGKGMAVRWGSAWEGGGAPAFWPWVQVLRGLIRGRDPDELRELLGYGGPWVAGLLPELREVLPQLEIPAATGKEQERFAQFDAITVLLRSVSAESPLAVIIDDLHASDGPSILMLDFAARSLTDAPIFLLGAYQDVAARGRPEIESLIAGSTRSARRIALGRLGTEELAILVERHSGVSPDDRLVGELHVATEGNPFFAREVVRLLAAEGQLEADRSTLGTQIPLPDSVRETIRRRCEPLGADALDALRVAAVIGREFRLSTVERAGAFARADLIEVLNAATESGLVSPAADVPGLYRFTHGLMRETLYSDLSTAQQIRAHAAVGDALEVVYGEDVEPHLAELAHHYLLAAPGGYAEKAVDYAIRAGERAMRLLAYEGAERLFESALGALVLSETAEPARGAALLLALGRARVRTGSVAARDTLLAAAEAARRLELPELLADAALGFRAFARVPGVVDEEVVGLLEEALEYLDDSDSDLRARLLVRLAVQLYDDVDAARRRRELTEEAIAMARRLGGGSTLAYVLNNAQLATWSPDTREEELAWSDEVIALAERTGDLDLIETTRSRRIDLLLELDDFPGADVELEALARVVNEIPETRARAHLAAQRSRRAAIEGRLADAQALTSEAEELAARVGDSAMAIVTAAQRITLAWTRGRLEDVESTVQKLAAAAPGMPVFRAVLAQLYVHAGREAEARREYENLRADDFSGIPRNGSFLHALSVLSEVAPYLDDAAGARALYSLLLPFEKRNVISIQSAYAGPVSRYLALLATACGEHGAAREHVASATAAAERVGARPLVAMLHLDEARMLLGEGERARALEACGKAAEIADTIGADGVRERAEAVQDEIGGEDTAPPTAPTAPAAPAAPTAGSITREGDVWVLDYGESVIRVRDSKGLRYLARLLANPGVEVHAIELVGGSDPGGDTKARLALAEGEIQSAAESAGPLLDATAKASYRERLEDLRIEVEEAESFNDPERAARAREEMDFVARELAGAVGLGGRDRPTASNAERARVNATRAIKGAIKRIGDYDVNLARELESTVRTGTFCAYEPDPRRPIEWTVEDR